MSGRIFLNGFDTNGDKWSAAYVKTRNGYRYVVLHNEQRVASHSTYVEAVNQFDTAVTKPRPIN